MMPNMILEECIMSYRCFLVLYILDIVCGYRQFIPFTPYRSGNVLAYFPNSNTLAVGGTSGGLSFWNLQTATPALLTTFNSLSTENVLSIRWNTVNIWLAVVMTNNNLVLYSFVSNQLAVSESKLLVHTFPLTVVDWDTTTGTNLLLGTSVGIVDEYTISFTGLTTGLQSLSANTRIFRYFAGCRTSFIWRLNSTSFIVGCWEGKVNWFTESTATPTASIQLGDVSSTYFKARYRRSQTSLICLFGTQVYVINSTTQAVVVSFDTMPFVNPLSSLRADKVMDFDVYPGNSTATISPTKMLIRTMDSLAEYDLNAVITAATPPSQWRLGYSVSTMSSVSSGTVVQVVNAGDIAENNQPFIQLNATEGNSGVIDFSACWPTLGQFEQAGDKSDAICNGSPSVAIDIIFPFPFSKVRGSFVMQSLGSIAAQDCSTEKGPISSWTSAQSDQWIQVTPLTLPGNIQPLTECAPIFNFWQGSSVYVPLPGSGSGTPYVNAIESVQDCKLACAHSDECNTVQFKITSLSSSVDDSERLVSACALLNCPNPGQPPAPPSADFEIWSLSAANKTESLSTMYNGYVAFGSLNTVVHGGCASTDGLVPFSPNSVTVTIPETELSAAENTLRFQVSQYNADAQVRISDVNIDLFTDYVAPSNVLEQPFTSAGAYMVNTGLNSGSMNGPIAISMDGNTVATSDQNGNIAIFNIPLSNN